MATSLSVTGVNFAIRDATRPLIVLGPSLGTSVTALWEDVAALLSPYVDVLGWDLPGHGTSPALDGPLEGLTIEQLAADVAELASRAQEARGASGQPYWFAGVSVGGAVSLQVALDQPDAVAGAVLLCTGAKISTPEAWHERADLVEKAGTPTQVSGSASRWFAPGFLDARPDVGTRLLASLQTADRFGYAAVCRALAGFDVRARLGDVAVPVLAVAGAEDTATRVDLLGAIAAGVQRGRLEVLPRVAHLAPAEAPRAVAELILEHVQSNSPHAGPRQQRLAGAIPTRRAVLGDAHVSRAQSRTSEFTADFHDLITRYAWGEIWGRPGLDRRSRSIAVLTALIAGGHWEEFPMHVRAAVRNGLTRAEIGEVLLQSAIYCSVPSANRAFAIADDVLKEFDEQN